MFNIQNKNTQDTVTISKGPKRPKIYAQPNMCIDEK